VSSPNNQRILRQCGGQSYSPPREIVASSTTSPPTRTHTISETRICIEATAPDEFPRLSPLGTALQDASSEIDRHLLHSVPSAVSADGNNRPPSSDGEDAPSSMCIDEGFGDELSFLVDRTLDLEEQPTNSSTFMPYIY